MITTLAALGEDPEAHAAITNGPVTVQILMTADPSLSKKEATTRTNDLHKVYATANKRGYRILVPRIDFSKRPGTAAKVARDLAPAENGHALWCDVVLAAASKTSPEDQVKLKTEYDDFKLSYKLPTKVQLREALTELEALWLELEGNDPSLPGKLIGRAVSLLPSVGAAGSQLAAFGGMIRALVGVNASGASVMFPTYEAFVDTVCEQYQGILNVESAAGGERAHVVNALVGQQLTQQQVVLALADGRAPPFGGTLGAGRERGPGKPKNKCGCCTSAACDSVTSKPEDCTSMNFTKPLQVSATVSKGQVRFGWSCRAHVAQNPGIKTLKGVQVNYISEQEARKIVDSKKARTGTNAVHVHSNAGVAVDDAFWEALDSFDDEHGILMALEGGSSAGEAPTEPKTNASPY